MECLNCKTPVPQTPGKRPKLYCSDTCRIAFFRQKKAAERVIKAKGGPKNDYDVPENPTSEETGRQFFFEPSKAQAVLQGKKKRFKTMQLPEAEIIHIAETAKNYTPSALSTSRKVSQEEFHDNITGQAQKAETPYPKDWDKMGRIEKMKWLTANR